MQNELLPCEVNAKISCTDCDLCNNGCPVEAPYNVVKAIYPITTTPKTGVNIQELVKVAHPKYYNYLACLGFNWNEIDGVLDFLYFEAKALHIAEAQQIIDLIEQNCEVKK